MAWAIWTLLAIQILRLIIAPLIHGEDRDDTTYNGFAIIFNALVTLCLLWFAGALPGSPY